MKSRRVDRGKWFTGDPPLKVAYGTKPGRKDIADKTKPLEALRNALVETAGVGGGLWLSYIFVLFYLFIAAAGVTHRNLLFDGLLEDVFELQDKVALSVAGVIEPTLQSAEMRRSSDRPTNDLTAYDLYLRALAPIRSGEWEKERYLQGLDLLSQAIERDPRYGPALAAAAFCHQALHNAGWTKDESADRREGIDLARRALRVAGGDPDVLGLVARVLGYFGEDLRAAIALIDRSLELNPSFALGWEWSGWLRLWAGQPDVAIDHFGTSMRLNPLYRRAGPHLGIGMGHFFSLHFEDAAAMLLLSLQEIPSWVPTYRFLASCYAQMGRLEEAHDMVRQLRAITTEVIPSAAHWRNREHRELFLSGLRLAAGEAP
jgi:tetratricopeptide (TPR) repeat protein